MPPSLQKFKRILNEIPQAVDDSLMGLAMCNRGLVLLEGERVIMRRDHLSLKGKVKIVSGVGGGHDPGPTGFVGPGMLTAGIAGEIFRCPSAHTILKIVRELGVDHPEGVLIIGLNYIEDRLNFGLAVERAISENINVRLLIVGDDCSVPNPPEALGRRGLAGIVFVYKIAGAMAEDGLDIDTIHAACQEVCLNEIFTLGVGLRPPTIPGCPSMYKIPDEEVELGIGIGIDSGVLLIPISTAKVIVHTILDHLLPASSLAPQAEVAVFINNFGGSSKLEEAIFAKEMLQQLGARQVNVRRIYTGMFITSLDMSGMSVTLVNLKSPEKYIQYLDAETPVPGWPRVLSGHHVGFGGVDDVALPVMLPMRRVVEFEKRMSLSLGPHLSGRGAYNMERIIRFAAEAVMSVAATLNTQDAESGDADCGSNLKRGVEGILQALDNHEIDTARPYATLEQLCSVSEHRMSGTSGALYSIFFAAAAGPFSKMPEDAKIDERSWLNALREGIEAIKRYGMAKKSDRTMLEPLIAAEEAGRELLRRGVTDYKCISESMAEAAERASYETISMAANCGRACFAIKAPLKMPDAGAFCVAVWIKAVAEGVNLVTFC